MTMGLGIETDIAYGLVGVGYALNEAIVGNTQKTSSAYPNLPVNMMEEGLINTVAYSLWLNDLGMAVRDSSQSCMILIFTQMQAPATFSLAESTPRSIMGT
jgi:hypothetical protein